MNKYQRLDFSWWVVHITATKHYICLDCTATMSCLYCYVVIFTCMKFMILWTIKWMKRPKKKNPVKAIRWWAAGGTSSGCHGCCSCHCGVKSFAVEHCDLWPFHSALSACWSAHHVEHCELKKKQNNNVSFPLNGVVVNVRPFAHLVGEQRRQQAWSYMCQK